MSRIGIIGVGHLFRGDDAAGLLVVRELRQILSEKVRHSIRIIECCGDMTQLLDCFREFETVYIVDAVCSQKTVEKTVQRTANAPQLGRVHFLDGIHKALPQVDFLTSSHAWGVMQAIELGRTLGVLPRRLKIIGIEGQKFGMPADTVNPEDRALSPEVSQAIDRVVTLLAHTIQNRLRCGGDPYA